MSSVKESNLNNYPWVSDLNSYPKLQEHLSEKFQGLDLKCSDTKNPEVEKGPIKQKNIHPRLENVLKKGQFTRSRSYSVAQKGQDSFSKFISKQQILNSNSKKEIPDTYFSTFEDLVAVLIFTGIILVVEEKEGEGVKVRFVKTMPKAIRNVDTSGMNVKNAVCCYTANEENRYFILKENIEGKTIQVRIAKKNEVNSFVKFCDEKDFKKNPKRIFLEDLNEHVKGQGHQYAHLLES